MALPDQKVTSSLHLNNFDSFFVAFMFTEWFRDKRIKFNGVEWTVIFYWIQID